jgi:FixJ family two-component response regulator
VTFPAQAGFVHVIDDDASWRTSMERLISAAGHRVALYESAEHFLASAPADAPGCILLDMRMPGLTGLQLQQRLVEMRRPLPIIFISGHGDIPSSVLAMKAGAENFLTKPVGTVVLLEAITRAIARAREERDRMGQLDAMRSRVDTLTPTERKVFALVVRGMLNKRIATELGTAERTIKWHRQHVMQKLELDSLAELVSLAERLGLVGTHKYPNVDSE